ncbi:MAG TPA: hypothetical protein ENN33_07105 [Ignavibacteria bacterium]|nr:hypothetical protein [Ignavibacteria bacterium]
MIQNRRYRILCDPRAKITSGEKTEKGLPASLPYFDISPFPELVEAYGEQPEELFLYFPSDEIPDFFNDEFNLYGSNGQKKRSCDSVTCIHRIDETINGVTYHAGQETECVCRKLNLPEKDKNKCVYVMYLKAWIALPDTGKIENPLCYLFRTRSENSGANIYSELEKIKTLAGGVLRGIKFSLSVRMVSNRKDAKKRFPIWVLQSVGMMSDIRRQISGRVDGIQQEEVKAIEQNTKMGTYVANANLPKKENKEAHLKKIKNILVECYPGKSKENKEKKKELLVEFFGTSKWDEVKRMPADVLERSYTGLKEKLETGDDEDLPFDENGNPVERG